MVTEHKIIIFLKNRAVKKVYFLKKLIENDPYL